MMPSTAVVGVESLGRTQALRLRRLIFGGVASAAVFGVLAATVALDGNAMLLLAVAISVGFPWLIWRVPAATPVAMLAVACLVEQFGGITGGMITNRIPLFTSLQDGFHIHGAFINPFELMVLTMITVWLLRAAAERSLRVAASPIAAGFIALLVVVVFAEVYGLSRGGNFTFAMWEARPWAYLAVGYLLTAALLRGPGALQALPWAFVLGTGIKGIQGVVNFIQVHGAWPRPEAVLAHEEAFFFGIYAVVVAGLWLWRIEGRLRTTATLLLPFVVVADLVNSRRSAWIILGGGLILLLVLTWIRMPERRFQLARLAAILALVGVVYSAVFWNSSSFLAQPVRAIRSSVAPSERDRQSNLYRTTEDANLNFNIRQSPIIGKGFGIPINYVFTIVDLSGSDPLIKYVPHDSIRYIWMRMGIPGMIAFWFVIGIALVTACRVVRIADPADAFIATIGACALVGYAVEGQFDYGFFWFRMAVFVGIWIGAVEVVSRRTMDRRAQHLLAA